MLRAEREDPRSMLPTATPTTTANNTAHSKGSFLITRTNPVCVPTGSNDNTELGHIH